MYLNSNQLTWYKHKDVLFEAYKDVVLAGIGVGTYTKFASKRRDSERVTQAKKRIGHFTVVCLVTWPLSGSEAEGDLVLI